MTFKEKLRYIFLGPKTEKKVYPEGVIGGYDSRPFDTIEYNLDYAGQKLIYNQDNETKNEIKIFSRNYKNTTFINVLVANTPSDFNPDNYYYDNLKELLIKNEIEPQEKSIVLMIFQHKDEKNISFCKSFCKSQKYHFVQGLIYNPKDVEMQYYKPVPDFYRHYDLFCENLYFDCGFIDPTRE